MEHEMGVLTHPFKFFFVYIKTQRGDVQPEEIFNPTLDTASMSDVSGVEYSKTASWSRSCPRPTQV